MDRTRYEAGLTSITASRSISTINKGVELLSVELTLIFCWGMNVCRSVFFS